MLNRYKPMFKPEPYHGLRFILFFILSIVLVCLDHNVYYLKLIRSELTQWVYPLQWVINAPIVWQDKCRRYLVSHKAVIEENERYTQQQLKLNGKILKLEALELENAQLKELLQVSQNNPEIYQFAQIIQVDPNPLSHLVLINKGKRNGAYLRQPLIDAWGVIGKVVKVNNISSQVMLISHLSHGIPVENIRNGLRAIAVGNNSSDYIELQHVPLTASFKVGDRLISSGLSGGFPPGYPVGIIHEIKAEPGEAFAKVLIKPSAKINQSRHVLLIKFEPPKME